MAKSTTASKSPRKPRRKAAPAGSAGLPPEALKAEPPAGVRDLCRAIEADGGAVLAPYRDPLGGKWLVMAALPLEQVEPTPYQRGLSEAHFKRLADAIGKTGRYLDPVIAIRAGERKYQTPNGHHRASAMKRLGAKSITAIVVTEPEVARLILALNVEKSHNLREKSLEVVKLARDLAGLPDAREDGFALEFEEPSFLTLGIAYEKRPRFAGGAYHPLLKRCDVFLDAALAKALERREKRVDALLLIDDRVGEIVAGLKAKGMDSPYLKNYVVARINPIRFHKGDPPPLDDVLDRMAKSAAAFSVERVTVADLARSGVPASGTEE